MLELAPSRQSLLERALSIVTGARCGEGVLTIRSFAFVNVVLVGVWLTSRQPTASQASA